jgi:RNA-directed DNA polymerase
MRKRTWYSLYDKVYKRTNLVSAFEQVKKNKGAPGVDKVTIEGYETKLEDNLEVGRLRLLFCIIIKFGALESN